MERTALNLLLSRSWCVSLSLSSGRQTVGAWCRPSGPRSMSGARALRRPWPFSAVHGRAAALSKCARPFRKPWVARWRCRGLFEAGHASWALVLPAAAAVAGRPKVSPRLLASAWKLWMKEKWPLCTVRAARGALLEDVVVLQPVHPLGSLPHEDKDLHPPGVAELEGVDVVEAHGAVRRQAGKVQSHVGQSGLPARGAASAAGHLGAEEGARAARGLLPLAPGEPVQ